jgi:hypothetical protein
VPPLETAYARQKSQIKTDTIKEMAAGILKATKEMARPFRGGKAQ